MKGKTVIITGGSSGIGKACAFKFATEGANVVISGRNSSNLEIAFQELLKISPNILAVNSDVSEYEDCKKIIDASINRFGHIDVLINNAGISMRGLFADTNMEVLKKVVAINFWGTVYCSKLALPFILQSKGSIVGISSIAGKKGLPGRTAYSASKFAMEGFLETLRTENLKTGIHVLVACPGFTASGIRNSSMGPDGIPQNESPRDESGMMSAATVADHIYIAVIHRKRDLILTFNGKITVWLNKFFPSLMDKIVFNHMAKEPGSPFK
ncbi:MAG: SDR family oxidoreductase [Bacteroidetes bacterium]|nr:SDR family oxidoreductase [Bacteroidota bacterium]